jgi:DNA-binding CsgD family transcriptional regulator
VTTPGPMARRLARLRRRVLSTRQPIVWLRALPGSGKSRLLLALQRHAAFQAREWMFLDAPDAATLAPHLNARPVERRLLIASRAAGPTAAALLIPAIYGRVDVIDEHELFLGAVDCRAAGVTALLTATGGWPLLVDGHLAGRAEEMMQMLPAFLDQEVLPGLPTPVVTGLFAALPAPLSAQAVRHLFGELPLHPLLRATPQGVTVAGHWVRDALLKLRTRPKVLQRAILDEIIQLHTRFAEPAGAIVSLLELGQYARAVEVFDAAGGMFFGYRQGYQALVRVLESFGAEGERRTETVFLARLHLLMKSGRSREALLRLDAQYSGLPIDLRRLRVSHRPYALLMRLDLSLDLDESPALDVIASWGRLDAYLAPGDDMARGILYNTMAIGFLQAGALLQAQQFAEDALAAYRRIGSLYLSHYMLLHLCDLSLRRSRLRLAKAQLAEAQSALDESGLAFNSEPAIIESFRARIAYEGRFADSPEDVERILEAMLRGDSWSDLISAMAAHFVFAAFWQRGLRIALERLEHCALTLNRRHGALHNQRIELIRIRLYQVARRHDEAGMRLDEYDFDLRDRRGFASDAEEGLIRLRYEIAQGRPPAAAFQLADKLARRTGLEVRHKLALSILQAHLHHRAGEAGIARRHLVRALRAAAAEDLLAALIEDGESLEKLLPLFLANPGPGNEPLAAFAQRVDRLLRTLPATPLYSKALAGVTRAEHRILSYVADGYTNKQIARALGSSESVVKFHLRNLFRKMDVSSRAALRQEAERRGIRT